MTRPAWDDDLSILCSDAPSNVRAEAAARIEAELSRARSNALEEAAKVADEIGNADLALSDKHSNTDYDLTEEYKGKALRGFVIASAIRALSKDNDHG